MNNLINSVILYDGSGKFTRIKKQIANILKNNNEGKFYSYYDNLAEVFPPLDETLNKAIYNARDKRDTEAVKKFTKSRLFQHIKNM